MTLILRAVNAGTVAGVVALFAFAQLPLARHATVALAAFGIVATIAALALAGAPNVRRIKR